MVKNDELKLFISYSHLDESPHIENFIRHIAPLRDNGHIENWYDRKIIASEDFQEKIDNQLEDADIICLFISANFLSSPNCIAEKKRALHLRENNGISVLPIIISDCAWRDDKDIKDLLALPKDGEAVCNFANQDKGWYNVYEGLKSLASKITKIKKLQITDKFQEFLQDAEMLTKAHSKKEMVNLGDIFIYPDAEKYDYAKLYEKTISFSEIIRDIPIYSKVAIAGEEQAGKTTLCKIIFNDLRRKNYIPVYLSDRKNRYAGLIENQISKAFQYQYGEKEIDEIYTDRIVPILDDFHYARNKEKHISALNKYRHYVVIVDDIYGLNIKDNTLLSLFTYYKIKEFKPSLRYNLIKKWVGLSGKKAGWQISENTFYQDIDKTTELIDSTLGKTIGSGIMPAYPFFILSTIVTYEAFSIPLHQEITSQGYCYQAFVYFYLKKQGVKNDEIDVYINFLTEISYYFYKENKIELSFDDFESFMNTYLEKYNLPIEQSILLTNLNEILPKDSFNNYSFRYYYLYYFFVAKYLAENLENDSAKKEIRKEIENIVSNLHVNENAYIAVFLAHHSKNVKILDDIILEAVGLFENNDTAKLDFDEVGFFDRNAEKVIKSALPSNHMTPEQVREERMRIKDELEEGEDEEEGRDKEADEIEFENEIRRSIKTVEVLGHIIKNRAGSLEKTKLKQILEEGMNVHLRILSYFFELIENEKKQKLVIDYILKQLEQDLKQGKRNKSDKSLSEQAVKIFWNLNFFVVCGVIYKIIHSLGSDKLIDIFKDVCDKKDTPATFIIKHGFLMWYAKNLKVEEIAERISYKDFSEIGRRVMELIIVEHCSVHSVGYRDKQRVVSKIGISHESL